MNSAAIGIRILASDGASINSSGAVSDGDSSEDMSRRNRDRAVAAVEHTIENYAP